ncbi:MAG: hypothetical protein LBD41_04325 [Clostridiales Family XIII bacterium]|jgi:hypothetical protein|nr:hypothetical protein [Clostridiales Family XIII bacterium]
MVVANSIKEAAKILSFPGVFGEESAEPSIIKFIKGKIAVSAPVKTVGFNTIITPQGAIDSGAYATPAHADVVNGTEVIFTAYEPYSWKFIGWYKNNQLISTDKITTIDIYDPYTSLIQYEARYEFDETRILRNGRYLEIGKGWIIDIKFDGYSNYKGRMVINNSTVGDYFFVISEITENTFVIQPDPLVTQPEEINATFVYEASSIGLNLVCNTSTEGNNLYIRPGSTLTLKWTNDLT